MDETCGLCLQDRPLVKSHIIPKSLLFLGEPTNRPLVVLSSDAPGNVRRTPAGEWSRIVCGDCERSFHGDDECLLAFVRALPLAPVPHPGATDISGFDLIKLRRAFVSVLFRAHLSKRAMFNKVDLGRRHGESLRRFLTAEEDQFPAAYSVYLRHIPSDIGRGVFSPFNERWNGVNAYRVYVPNVSAMIRVDQRPMPHPWPRFALVSGDLPFAMRSDRLTRGESEVAAKFIDDATAEKVARILGA